VNSGRAPRCRTGQGELFPRTDRDDVRQCLWDGKQFRPTPSISGAVTEHFCSPACAWASLEAKQRAARHTNRSRSLSG
jgi:hypothetical protein